MIYATLKTLHLLAVLLWVGGMAFAHLFLRPALGVLAGPQRLALMHEVLRRFLAAVSVASVLAVATGIWMLGGWPSRRSSPAAVLRCRPAGW